MALDIGVPSSKPVTDEQWYDALFINPVYLMVIVGAILGVTFWALCIRGGSRSAPSTQTAVEDDAEDLELGGVEMAPGSGGKSLGSQNGFTSVSGVDDDAATVVAASGSSFANAKEEGSASKFLISVLISIGIPSFGTSKYCAILKDNYLSTIDQLKQLDNSDWKRLGLPLVIEEALRKTLLEHTNKEGRFSGVAPSSSDKRVKGLDLKAAKKSVATNKDSQ
jgi:hypothetical protein